MSLTPKQEKFCLAYIETGNASEAYRRSYSAENMKEATVQRKAFELLKDGKITAAIQLLREKATAKAVKKLEISKEWVLDQLVENVKMAKQAEPVYDNEGNPVGEYKQNLAASNKALELIGKEIGMFVDRKEVRTGPLDGIAHDDKVAALDLIQAEIRRRKELAGQHEPSRTTH